MALLMLSVSSYLLPGDTQEQASGMSLEDLLRMESVISGQTSPKWSPDGSQIIFASTLNKGGPVGISPEGGFPISFPIDFVRGGHDLRFSPDGKWISYISYRDHNDEVYVWSLREGQEIKLTNLEGRINNTLSWSPDSRWIVLSNNCRGDFDIWKVAVPSGKISRLTSAEQDEVCPTWTPDSKKIIYVRMDERRVDHDVLEISADGQNPRLVVSDKDFFDYGDYGQGWMFGYPWVSPDGKSVLFRSQRSGWINYWVVPIEGGEPRQIAPEEADQNHARWSPDGRLIAYTSNHNGTLDLRIVPAAGGSPQILMAPKMGVCEDPEWSPDGARISFALTTTTRPKDLFVMSLKSGKINQLTHSLPAGNPEEKLVVPEKISYRSADGLNISAYLYKPRKINTGEKFPGVVWIHGGYKGGGNWQFMESFLLQRNSSQQDVQFFVQNGYVVLQPNTRGSTGYGKNFERANNGRWGENELKDILAGVDFLKTLPFVNGEKIGVKGRSYGATMALVAVTKAPRSFQAAIAEAPLVDWANGIVNHYPIDIIKMFEYEIGPLRGNENLYRELSPINFVENISAPVFIYQGDGKSEGAIDFAKSHGYVVLPDAHLFAEKLLRYFKVYQYKAYRSGGYYVSSLESRRQCLLDRLNFFDRFLKNQKESP